MFWLRSHYRWLTAALFVSLCLLGALAQQPQPRKNQGSDSQKALRKGGADPSPYRAWLDEDVHWIIAAEERAAFEKLSTDAERDQFVEQFWRHRDPTPETVENEFKEEHYRRLAYSNVHFATKGPGWKSDRGRAYIVLGPPDEIDHPTATPVEKSQAQGENALSAPTEEIWRYLYRTPTSAPHDQVWSDGRHNQAGAVVILRFVDSCRCGEYRLVLEPSQKDPFK